MAINLHDQAKAAIKSSLAENLKHIHVKHGMLLQHISVFFAAYKANECLPTGKMYDTLVDYVDDFPLIEFVTEILRRELNENLPYKPDETEPRSLIEIEGYADPHEAAERIVSKLISLPWDYTISLILPDKIMPASILTEGPVEFGSGRIRNFDLLMDQQFPLTHPNSKIENIREPGIASLLTNNNRSWERSLYIQQEEKGFIGLYGGGSVMDRIARRLESYLGLGLSMKLFTYQYKYENGNPSCEWIVHQRIDSDWRLSTRFKVEEDILDVIKHLTSFRFETSYPEQDRPRWLQGAARRIGDVLKSESSKTIELASKWFFDSFKGNDDTLKYIRMMTALEILLGEHADVSKASLGDILGNRLAYMIGKSHSDRAEILKNFKRIYSVRSAILHHGKHKLRGDERTYLSTLRKFCERAIEEEARLILA